MAPPKSCWLCLKCKEEGRPLDDVYNALTANDICPIHKTNMQEININIDDYLILEKTSNNITFFDAMIKLKQDDIVEYELKMSQFRSQISQQAQIQESSKISDSPKCPYCNSTNLKKISGFSKAGSVALFGIFAVGKVGKQWHCNSCKSDF